MIALMLRDILALKWLFAGAVVGSVLLLPASTFLIDSEAYPFPIGPVVVLFAFGFFLCGMVFQTDEKHKTDVIVCSMPYSRAKIVAARYLLSVVVFTAMSGIGYGVQTAVAIAMPSGVEPNAIVGYFAGSVLGLLLLFLVYPAYFRLGIVGGQAVLFVVFFSVSFLVSAAVRVETANIQAGNVSATAELVLSLSRSQAYLVVLASVVTVGVLSFLLSAHLYRGREF